jgi:putative lipoic acid-binding regulatory protein
MKKENGNSYDSFREKLDQQYNWPSLYTFKFIVPQGNEMQVRELFPGTEVLEKRSRKGNYTSLTARFMADSSDAIIAVYLKAHHIDGLIAL